MENFEEQLNRNLKGKDLEKAAKIEEAIELYETNIKEGFDGSHPYNRLAIIYKKTGRRDDEIRVLKLAIATFERVAERGRADGATKLQKFKDKLDAAIKRKTNPLLNRN